MVGVEKLPCFRTVVALRDPLTVTLSFAWILTQQPVLPTSRRSASTMDKDEVIKLDFEHF